MKQWVGVFIIIFLFSHSAVKSQDSLKREKKVKLVPLPALFYTPETRLGFGALVSGVFNLGDKETTRNSNGQVLAAYTLNKQIIFQTKHNVFTPNEKFIWNGELSYYDFPILYYGIGNDTNADFEENLEYEVIIFRERLLKKIRKHVFAGIQYQFNKLYNINYEPQFLIEDKPIIESGAGVNSGVGFSTIYDSRNNVLNASSGIFAEFSTFFHGAFIGSDYNFSRFTTDFRKFWPLNDQDVLAIQFFGQYNTFGAPFRELAQLGGESIMRGYYNGRYRDQGQMAFQTEYRKQIISWVGIVFFGALGDVMHDFGELNISDLKYTFGGGLRLMVNKSDRLNIRIDYGIGQNTSGFYFAFAEAF